MAVMGVQLVVSLITASIMQKMSPHCSFARWLLCSCSLHRYKHPSEEELCALAGKQKPKTRRDRRMNGVTEEKPLSVPKDINLHLETAPITTVDALVLRYFLEYQWFVDFAVYSTLIYLFTEGYYCLVDPCKEMNIGVLWCLLTVFFSVKIFFMVMHHYFRSEEGGERSVCLIFAFFFLLLALNASFLPAPSLRLNIESDFARGFFGRLREERRGLNSLTENVFLPSVLWTLEIPITKLTFKLGLVAFCSFLGACLTFPGLRLEEETHTWLGTGQGLGFLALSLPVISLAPSALLLQGRDFLPGPHNQAGVGMSDAAYNSTRLWTIVALCLLRLAMTRHHLQAYLGLAERWVEQMKREAGRIAIQEIQRRVGALHFPPTCCSGGHLILRILTRPSPLCLAGNYSWGLFPEPQPASPAAGPTLPAAPWAEGEGGEDVQATVAQITGALGAVFSPLFYRGLFAFLTWWVAVCQVITSLFGLYFHQYLAA
uniref:Transmembrane protein 161A n=1 Tax=Pelodiscus sinensis TaxID=13735 RepID=K7FHD2_PELSI